MRLRREGGRAKEGNWDGVREEGRRGTGESEQEE